MGMIARIARVCAIWADHHDPDAWLAYQGIARLVLAELHEPTGAMLDADGGEDAIDCWHAMIDAALAEPDQTKPE